MITKPMDVLAHFEVRKTKAQKTAFINAVTAYAQHQGYEVRTESGARGCRNVVLGDPSKAKFLVTAHYDTCASIGIPNIITPCNPVTFLLYQFLVVGLFFLGAFLVGGLVSLVTDSAELIFLAGYVAYFGLLILMMVGPANRHTANDNTSGVVTLLEIAATLPESLRDRVAFVLFDLEEAGLIGSASYRKAHKAETERQIVLNLDCVGDGDEIVLFPTKKLKKDSHKLACFQKILGKQGRKRIALHTKGFSYYPSDQKNFPYGVGISALRRNKWVGLYCGRIHTSRDTVLEHSNVNLLRAALITLIDKEK